MVSTTKYYLFMLDADPKLEGSLEPISDVKKFLMQATLQTPETSTS
jgi:hypothetical protein